MTGILCNFEDFGSSMGMFINEKQIMCVTPHIQGRPEDYYRETVQVTVALNGQDFNEVESDAYVTFVGTGSDTRLLYLIITVLLLALLILAIVACCAGLVAVSTGGRRSVPKANVIPNHLRGDGGDTVQRSTLGDYSLVSASGR